MIIMLCILWPIIGITGFIFWWIKYFDLTCDTYDIIGIFISCIIGPFIFILYLMDCLKNVNFKTKIIIHKRK